MSTRYISEKGLETPITCIARLKREIELLREYRTRLVADVVTGKLDVRPVIQHLPPPELGQADLAAEPLEPAPTSDSLDGAGDLNETSLEDT